MGLARTEHAALTTDTELPDGMTLLLRPISAQDKVALAEGFAAMSPESRARRFLTAVPRLSPQMLRYFTEVDYLHHFALIAFTPDTEQLVAVGRYVRLKQRPEVAEVAVTVGDPYQGRGVGTVLMEALIAVAQAARITTFVASVREDNAAMRALLPARRTTMEREDYGVLSYQLDLAGRGAEVAERPVYRFYRAAAEAVCAARSGRVEQAG